MARNANESLREQTGVRGVEEILAAALAPFMRRCTAGAQCAN